jgi:hypothetical protein
VYALTRRGQALEPAIVALGRFGGRLLPERPDTEAFRARWAVVALKITFNAWQAHGVRADYQLKLDGEPYRLRVDDGVLHAQTGRGRAGGPHHPHDRAAPA